MINNYVLNESVLLEPLGDCPTAARPPGVLGWRFSVSNGTEPSASHAAPRACSAHRPTLHPLLICVCDCSFHGMGNVGREWRATNRERRQERKEDVGLNGRNNYFECGLVGRVGTHS